MTVPGRKAWVGSGPARLTYPVDGDPRGLGRLQGGKEEGGEKKGEKKEKKREEKKRAKPAAPPARQGYPVPALCDFCHARAPLSRPHPLPPLPPQPLALSVPALPQSPLQNPPSAPQHPPWTPLIQAPDTPPRHNLSRDSYPLPPSYLFVCMCTSMCTSNRCCCYPPAPVCKPPRLLLSFPHPRIFVSLIYPPTSFRLLKSHANGFFPRGFFRQIAPPPPRCRTRGLGGITYHGGDTRSAEQPDGQLFYRRYIAMHRIFPHGWGTRRAGAQTSSGEGRSYHASGTRLIGYP